MLPWLCVLLLMMQTSEPVMVTTLALGEFSEISDSRELVVRSPAEWQALWTAHGASEAAPAVDFSTKAVAAVFLGSRPSGGFRIAITGARREAGTLVIDYAVRRPA